MVLNDMLCNRLVRGVNHNQCEGSCLTLERALSIAASVETAINQSLSVNQYQQQPPLNREEPTNIFKIIESKPDRSCCCNANHKPERCPFKDKKCFYCKAKGHTIKVCRKKLKTSKDKTHQIHQMSHANQDSNETSRGQNKGKI